MADFRYLELGPEPGEPTPAVLDYWDLCRIAPPPRLLRRYPLTHYDRHRWLPLHEVEREAVSWLPAKLPDPVVWGPPGGLRLFIAAEAPDDGERLRAIAMRTGRTLRVLPVLAEALDRFLAERYPAPEEAQAPRAKRWWGKATDR